MPKSITFDNFDFGLDLRKGLSTSDANRLRVIKNAHTTDGKTIRKRAGLVEVATLEAGTIGLFAGQGKLNTFYAGSSTITHADPLFQANRLTRTSGTLAVQTIHYADVFNGFLYVSARYADKSVRHHYLDGTAITEVTDVNCPHTVQVAKIASKIWAISPNGDTVRYSATNTPRDWTTANDAGFLPVGLQQSGSNVATALGFYSNRLVVFFSDSSQVWQVDVDPARNAFLQSVDVGTVLPYSQVNMAGDVFFLSKGGVKTITRQEQTTNLIDSDVGSPIDREIIKGNIVNTANARGQYYRGAGQYWLYSGTKVAVYTFSRTASVSAWSVYEYPFNIDYVCELNGDLYLRSGNKVYRLDESVKTDAGQVYPVEIEMAYLDFKSSGMMKHIMAMDAVVTGTCQISHRYDPRYVDLITDPAVTVTGDTRPSTLFPVELMTTSLAPVIRNNDDQEFELHQLSYYFENLSPV